MTMVAPTPWLVHVMQMGHNVAIVARDGSHVCHIKGTASPRTGDREFTDEENLLIAQRIVAAVNGSAEAIENAVVSAMNEAIDSGTFDQPMRARFGILPKSIA